MKKWPKSWFKYLNFPGIFTGIGYIPRATAINYVPWAIVGFIFQYVVRRRHFAWWSKYNYVLSAALESGVAPSIVFVFFCLRYLRTGSRRRYCREWWGNTVYLNTTDAASVAYKPVPNSGTFGLTSW